MYMTAARPPPAVQRRVSKRSATDRNIFQQTTQGKTNTRATHGKNWKIRDVFILWLNHQHDHPDQHQDFYFKATYRYVDVPLYGLLDKDGPRIKIDRYLGEDVEDHGQDCQVHWDPSTSEPLHHVLRESPHLGLRWSMWYLQGIHYSTSQVP